MNLGPKLLVVACLMLLTAPAPAAPGGQYTSSHGYSFNNPVSAFCNDLTWNTMNARLTYKALLKRKGYSDSQIEAMSTKRMIEILGAEAESGPAPSPAVAAASRFKPSGTRLYLSELARSLASDAEGRRALLQVFEAGLKAYEEGAAESGFVNDLAGAMAYFIGVSYYLIRGEEPDEKGLDEVGLALRRSMDTPRVKAISDPEKQRFYELMIGLGTYLAAVYGQAARDGDEKATEAVRKAAGESLRGFLGLDPASIRITRAGLEIAGAR